MHLPGALGMGGQSARQRQDQSGSRQDASAAKLSLTRQTGKPHDAVLLVSHSI
jgi:hypothetical protein